jgi:hypothetical protein
MQQLRDVLRGLRPIHYVSAVGFIAPPLMIALELSRCWCRGASSGVRAALAHDKHG